MNAKIYYDIKKNIDQGIFKMVRLVQKTEGQRLPSVIIEYNPVAGEHKTTATHKLNQIRDKCNKFLPDGIYTLQCRTSTSNKTAIEEYEIIIQKQGVIKHNDVEDKTNEQVEQISLDQYIELVNENTALKIVNAELRAELLFIEKYKVGRVPTLADGSPVPEKKDGNEILADVLSQALPSVMNLMGQHMEYKHKALELQDRNPEKKKGMKKILTKKEPTFEQEAQEEAAYMAKLDDAAFDKEMDLLEADDPELYDRVCEILGVEEEEEEDDQQEEEEEDDEE